MSTIELHLALGSNPRTEALLSGRAKPQGMALRRTRLALGERAPADADVTEIPLGHHLAALGAGDRSRVGVPVFTARSFPHVDLFVRSDSAIDSPAALAGGRVGVADPASSEALWTRGALEHEFAVAAGTHFVEFSGAEALASGDLDAAVLARTTRAPGLRTLFRDPRAEARRYHEATGLFPILSVVVVSAAIVERYPWVVLNLFSAFLEAKLQAGAETAGRLAPFVDTGTVSAATAEALATDLFPYGVASQRSQLEAAATYACEQVLTVDPLTLAEIFYPPTLEL